MENKPKAPAGATHYDELLHHWKQDGCVWYVYKCGAGWVESTPSSPLKPLWMES